ncbi:MAG: hypothetical protein KGR48_10665 [Alphaproteobacteria bacterium]|nr:hypothetical protein [Alphaproteobacteria bacterium]MDE2013318.1 hypothetical protein [Alphaproteobacteria bacterium]MDE2072254.1 hypothetical protein [Alphaproteobacteria bacterium]
MKGVLKHLRPLPAVFVLAFVLLAIKGTGLVLDARAASPSAAAASAAPAQSSAPTKSDAAAADVTDTDSVTSASEVDVLTSLAKRRAALDARAQALDMRANLIAAAEQRVDAKIADLKVLQNQIQALLGQRDAAQEKQIASLVKVYSSMKPRDAARIFNTLDEPVLLAVAGAMKPDALALIMAQMEPKQAQDLTVKLAGKLKLPQEAALPQAQLPAMALPQPATPAATAPQTGAPVNPSANPPAKPPASAPAAAPAAVPGNGASSGR